MSTPKRRQAAEPQRQCQYGTGCYRKNPQHFTEYAHQHLSDIRYNADKSATRTYTVPEALLMSREIVLEQLAILDRLFPTDGAASAKRPRPAGTTSTDNEQSTGASGSTSAITAALPTKAVDRPSTSVSSTVIAPTSSTASSSTPLISQSEQLAAYRARHSSNAAAAAQLQPSASSSANVSAPSSSPSANRAANPHSRPPPKNISDYIAVVRPRGQMAAKLSAAAPYNFFLTTITAEPATHDEPLSVTFQELLDTSLGTIESSVQMNFMIDIGWLLGHYYFAGCLDKPLLVLYGDGTPELATISTKKPQVTAVQVQMSSPFGTHHTKMMLLGYTDGSMRCIVSTANLVEDDWHNRTQGLWISPRCARLPADADTGAGGGPTGFRDDLLRYLNAYGLAALQPWMARVRQSDFSAVNVFFVASVPGGHREAAGRGHDWGHPRVGRLLGQHCAPVDDAAPIVAQCSSIGSLGPSVQSWCMADVANSFRRDSAPLGLRRLPGFRLVYPSYANVRASHDGLLGGGCLPYRRAINVKQPWLRQHLSQWRSAARSRTRAMPHIKTYCRWSAATGGGLYWFCLTSANLSKAAWGAFNKSGRLEAPLRIMSYEAGVLFLPKFVLGAGERCFPLVAGSSWPAFPMPYDYAELRPYGTDDEPFVMDYLLERM